MGTRCRIQLLGGLRVYQGQREITQFRTQKTAALLAYLAYHLPRGHPRDVLIGLLWPEGSAESSRHNLSVALSSLRRDLEPPGVPDGAVLVTNRFSVGLAPAAVTTDVWEFEAGLRAARSVSGSEERIALLVQAVDLHRGELLPGFYDDWIPPEQHRLRSLLLQTLEQLSAELEQAAEYERALFYALRAAHTDPLHETAHRAVMRLHAAMGQPAAALRHYEELAAHLKAELNAAPAAATRALAAELTGGSACPARTAVPAERAGDPAPEPSLPPVPRELLEPVGGAVPLGSRFYVPRPADREFRQAIERGDSVVLVKGARQVGKTSLLARELQHAREAGARVVCTDFQVLSEAHLASADSLFRVLASWISEQLDLDAVPTEMWEDGGAGLNLRRYMRREVLSRLETRLVWGLDEVDRLFSCGYASEVFGIFRSWHNERALDPAGPWGRLTLAMAYATEAHLFISDLNQSPFNVGTRLVLEDFTWDQVAELNSRYGGPLRDAKELGRFYRLVGGHPYLVRRGLHEMATRHGTESDPRERPIDTFEANAEREEGIFSDHLRRLLAALARDPALTQALHAVLDGHPCPSAESFFRLRSAGVLTGEAAGEARLRCEVYARYLDRKLPM